MGALVVARVLKSYVTNVSWWCTVFGATVLITSMSLTVVDVFLRSTLKLGVPGAIELVKISLVLIFFSGMAYIQVVKEHVRVNFVIQKFSPTSKLAITTCADLIAMGIIFIISWQSVVQGKYEWAIGSNTGILGIPLWPWAMFIAFFMALFGLSVSISFFECLGELVAKGYKSYFLLVPGILVTLGLFGVAFWPNIFLPAKVEPNFFGGIALLLMFVLLFLHVHIGASMAMTVFLGMSYLVSPEAGLSMLSMTSMSTASNYVWSVLPLFMWMGLLVSAAGYSKDLYTMFYKWLGHTRGGLASASVGACAAFAAVVGDPMSGAVTMSTIALPEMKKYNYETKLSLGSIAAASTLGVLIPPSLSLIVYGIMVEQSIGRLFIAGIIPGILLAVMLIFLISILCYLNPKLGPAGPAATFREKIKFLKSSIPVLTLFLVVVGGIYAGIFTATEAGAIGTFSAVASGLAMKRLTLKVTFENAIGAVKMAGMIFFIFIYGTAVTQFFALSMLPSSLGEFLGGIEVSRYLILALIVALYFVLGCLMNGLPAIILTLPFVYPIMMKLGFDPIWFGIIVTIMVEIGAITPPIGITVFAISGISGVPMYTIFRGVTPFWLTMLLVIIILVIFPHLVLFLPNLMMGLG